MSEVSATGCQCQPSTFPFHCLRHRCRKTEHWYRLCRSRRDYFRLWEQGLGPGQHRRLPSRREVERSVTVGITAFRRPRCLEKLIASIRRFYPEIRILVADNGDRPADLSSYENLEYLQLPFDVGLSVCRNRLAATAETPYLFLSDHDLVFFDESCLQRLLDVLRADRCLGVAAGAQYDRRPNSPYLPCIAWAVDLEITAGRLTGRARTDLPTQQTPAGTAYRLVDMVHTSALFRRDVLQAVPWDEQLKNFEHVDYFLRLKRQGRWRAAFCPEAAWLHDRGLRNRAYTAYRNRAAEYRPRLERKWNVQTLELPQPLETRIEVGDIPGQLRALLAESQNRDPEPFTYDWRKDLPQWRQHLGPWADRPVRCLEIGVYEGRMACWLLEHVLLHPESRYLGLDNWRCYAADDPQLVEQRARANLAPYGPKAKLVTADAADWLQAAPQEHFDLVYIDGDHATASVLRDSRLAWPVLVPGGICVWDDYRGHPTVRAGVDQFLAESASGTFTILWQQDQLAVRKSADEPLPPEPDSQRR